MINGEEASSKDLFCLVDGKKVAKDMDLVTDLQSFSQPVKKEERLYADICFQIEARFLLFIQSSGSGLGRSSSDFVLGGKQATKRKNPLRVGC